MRTFDYYLCDFLPGSHDNSNLNFMFVNDDAFYIAGITQNQTYEQISFVLLRMFKNNQIQSKVFLNIF